MKNGFIYIIENDINDKVYIGQTKTSIEERWKKHINNSKNCPNKQVITMAMNKYGIQHFTIRLLVSAPADDLDFLEVYYIKKYDSFQNGYNMTLGGNNTSTSIPEECIRKIIILALTTKTNYTKIAKEVNVSDTTVRKILKRYDIEIKDRFTESKGNINNLQPHWGKHNDNLVKPCPVRIKELDKSFDSLLECANFLVNNNYTKTKNVFYVMKSISRVLSNKDYSRKTYLKFHLEKL